MISLLNKIFKFRRKEKVLSKVSPLKCEYGAHLLNFKDFRKIKAIPVMSNGLITGISCADPSKLKFLKKQYPNIQILRAPWDLIKEALDKSEAEIQSYTQDSIGKKLESAARTTLELIFTEADSLGAKYVELNLEPGLATYTFTTLDNKIAEGSINKAVKSPLIEFLMDKSECEIKAKKISISQSTDGFRLEWSKEDKVSSICTEDTSRSVLADFILIVDDNDTFSSILDKFLSQKGYFVLRASDGHQALLELDRTEGLPELIVCDLHMPGVNGSEFVYKIKQESLYESIPILMLTSDDHIDTQLSLLSLGADTFVSKSIDPIELIKKIEETMKSKKAKPKSKAA